MDETARIVSEMLTRLAAQTVAGRTGKELDGMAEAMLAEYGATSFNKGYKPEWAKEPYPATLCVSPNGIVVHGIPNDYQFREGDLITLDLGIMKNGVCGDAALTVAIGQVENKHSRLLYYARQAVYEYIRMLKPGVNTRVLAAHIQQWALQRGYTVNRRGAGHTIGAQMHMKPTLYNTVEDDVHTYGDIVEGSVVCVEPILTLSSDNIGQLLGDGWSVANIDRKYAAMFEHMVRVTANGNEILTTHFNDDRN